MIVGRSLETIGPHPGAVVTVGTFDGVHLGHRSIFGEVTRRASVLGVQSCVITFHPHPREVLRGGKVELLTSLEERLELIDSLGIDAALVLGFTYEFSRQTAREFYEQYVVRGMEAGEVIVGYDHMLGRDRESGIHELRQIGSENNIRVDVVDPVSLHGMIISSSRIRERLLTGDAERAAEMLGRPYRITGSVVVGDRRGRSLGFPTANVKPADVSRLVPADGVYAVAFHHQNQRWYGMMNIGVRPTMTSGSQRTIEVHLFNFEGDLYGRPVGIDVLKRIRPERVFPSAEELVAQIRRDREECMKIITSLPTA
jgi:riboflavin kinase / FMN adenylyltransferase